MSLGFSIARSSDRIQQRRGLETCLTVVLSIAALNTIYLSWRFVALFSGWVTPGTGICSWTTWIDCDKVLQTPEALAFVVPNAILALGFYTGAVIWWVFGRRLGEGYRHHVVRTLAVWLGIASVITVRFWWLLLHLDNLCPFCPWNHVLTYVAFFLALRIWQLTPRPTERLSWKPIIVLVVICVLWFWAWQGAWFLVLLGVRGLVTAL